MTARERIIAEHIRAVTFILGDPKRIVPSNTEQGYIVRRLIRRVIRLFQKAGIQSGCICELSGLVISQYQDVYPELGENRNFILEELRKAKRYLDRIESGRDRVLDGELAFRLYDTYGFPIEFTVELAKERGFYVDMEGFWQKSFRSLFAQKIGYGCAFPDKIIPGWPMW